MAQTNMLMGQCVAILDNISATPPPPLPLTNHGWLWSVVRWWLSKPNSTWSWLSAEWSEHATSVLFSSCPLAHSFWRSPELPGGITDGVEFDHLGLPGLGELRPPSQCSARRACAALPAVSCPGGHPACWHTLS